MSSDTTTSTPLGDSGAPTLPDLAPAIASEQAAESAEAMRAEHRDGEEAVHLGSLTDEELVVCLGSDEAAQPLGSWYSRLGEHPARVARTTALRSLTSREEVFVRSDEAGDLGAQVSGRLLGMLRLRHERVLLSAQMMTRQGPAWYLLRQVGEGQWLREMISEHGFHSFDLVRLDEAEQGFLQVIMQMPDDVTPSDVDLVQEPGPPAGELLSFLTKQRHVTQLALQHPDEDLARGLVVSVDESKHLTVGRQEDRRLRHRGADPEVVWQAWQAWVDAW